MWTPPEQKSRVSLFPSSQNLLRAGHVPVECISFQARTMAAAVSRAPSQPARRDALTLVASPPRLPDCCPTVAAVTPRIDRSRAIPSRGSAGWVGRAILFVLRLADGDASAVRGPRASAMPPRREIVGRGANEQRAATVVMAAAPVPPRGVLGGCECVCWTLSPVVYVRMVRCIDKTLIQYVSAGPYNTRSGPQELPRPFRRNSAQAMRPSFTRCFALIIWILQKGQAGQL